MSFFVGVDFSSPLDVMLFGVCVFYSLTSLFANRLNVKYLTRDGGFLTYSKFAKGVQFGPSVSSRFGMALLYSGGFALALVYLAAEIETHADAGLTIVGTLGTSRVALVSLLVAIHFGKRVSESLCVHVYSGTMPLASSLFIGSTYCCMAFTMAHYAGKAPALGEDSSTLLVSAITTFMLGSLGNFYHHLILANLRKKSSNDHKDDGNGTDANKDAKKRYYVPRGGLFEYVAAPHYFCELVGLFAVAIITRHWLAVLLIVASFVYLAERATAQTKWNREKFGAAYPVNRKHLIPFIF